MNLIEFLIDAYIDANLLILFAYVIWLALRAAGNLAAEGQDHRSQLRMTEGALAAVVISPFLAPILISQLSQLFPGTPLNATDFALAQYLHGKVQMDAQRFESILSFRAVMVKDVAALSTTFIWCVVATFAVGFLVSLGWLMRNVISLRRLLANIFDLRVSGRLVIGLSDETRVPFSTRGFVRRYVVLPMDMLARPDQLRLALTHELQHMRRRDVEIEVLLSLLQPFFFWNPAFYLWRRDIAELRELACDQAVIERKQVSAEAYAECLLAACRGAEANGRKSRQLAPAVPFFGFQSIQNKRNYAVLRRRICAICDHTKARLRARVLAGVIGASTVVAVLLLASSLHRSNDWSHDRLMLSTMVNLERLEIRNEVMALSGY